MSYETGGRMAPNCMFPVKNSYNNMQLNVQLANSAWPGARSENQLNVKKDANIRVRAWWRPDR